MVERARKDANNRLYQLEASMDYDPSADLEKIKAPVLAINFEDDELNPPELGMRLSTAVCMRSQGWTVKIEKWGSRSRKGSFAQETAIHQFLG